MINYMQSNQHLLSKLNVIGDDIWENLIINIKKNDKNTIIDHLNIISEFYNVELKNIIKDFLNYIIRKRSEYVTKKFLDFVEFIMHIQEPNINYLVNYSIVKLKTILIENQKV